MSYKAIDNSQSVIQHYGKKGMKWGVRSQHADLKANHDNNYNMSPREYFNRKGK